MKKVLVTGGGGYKGCILVPKLLKAGYLVVVYDLMLFGDKGLPKHPDLSVIKGDIRDITSYSKALKGCDSVIHMACISNDPSFDLDPSLSLPAPVSLELPLSSPRHLPPRRQGRPCKLQKSPSINAHMQRYFHNAFMFAMNDVVFTQDFIHWPIIFLLFVLI